MRDYSLRPIKSDQLRTLAQTSRTYDKGYGYFTTRQNMQINWPTLESVPDLLADLAKVQMHAIQTSGACIRNTTTDPFAGKIWVVGDVDMDHIDFIQRVGFDTFKLWDDQNALQALKK